MNSIPFNTATPPGSVVALPGKVPVVVRAKVSSRHGAGRAGFLNWLQEWNPTLSATLSVNYPEIYDNNDTLDAALASLPPAYGAPEYFAFAPVPGTQNIGSYDIPYEVAGSPQVNFRRWKRPTSELGSIAGLGDNSAPGLVDIPVVAPDPVAALQDVQTPVSAPITGWIDTVINAIGPLVQGVTQYKIMQTQLDRASKGLAPLDTATLQNITSVKAGIDPATQKTLLIGAGIVAAGLFFFGGHRGRA